MFLLRHLGEGSEGEGALDLADVVLQDRLRGEGLGEVEAVLYLEGLTDWTLLGAGAHRARRHPSRLPDVDGLVADIAGDSLLPQVQVDGGQRTAGDAGVEEGIRHVEESSLDVCHGVAVVTHHLGQGDLPDLVQLSLGEPDERVASLVPEPVTLPQVAELDADDAGEGGAHQPAVQRGLGQTTWQIYYLAAEVLDHMKVRKYFIAWLSTIKNKWHIAIVPSRYIRGNNSNTKY